MPQDQTYALNLVGYVPTSAPLPAQLRPATLAEFPDTAATRQKLYELVRMGVLDTPDHAGDFEPLDAFEAHIFGPCYYAEADTQVLALNSEDGQWVGLSSLRRTDTPHVSSFGLTAVRPEWRGRGVARALKAHALALAAARGDTRVLTHVNPNNAAMQAVNASLGFEVEL